MVNINAGEEVWVFKRKKEVEEERIKESQQNKEHLS